MPDRDRELIDAARILATAAHRNSKPLGAGKPCLAHASAVAEILEPYGADAVAAGWLCKTVEDMALTVDDLRAVGFPDRVIDAVDAVTPRPGEVYFDLIRRAAGDDLGRIVKLASNCHNVNGLDQMADRLRAAGLSKRYRRTRQILERALVAATARLDGLVTINGLCLSDLDMSESDFWFFALGHHPPHAALAAFQERARELKWDDDDMPAATVDNITTGWAIWTGTRTDWSFLPVPDDTTPGAFRATWLSGL